MHITDEEREKLKQLVAELRELANNERQAGDLRRQQNAVKMRFYGHAEAYEDAARRIELILGTDEKADDAEDSNTLMLDDGKTSKTTGKE